MSPPADRTERNAYFRARYCQAPGPTAATADEDARFAAEALERGELEPGLHALTAALALDPFHPERVALLDRYLAAGGEPLDEFLNASGNIPWEAFAALRAYAAHAKGDLPRAIGLLEELCQRAPGMQYPEAWGLTWLTPEAVGRLGADPVLRFLGRFVQDRYPEPADTTEHQRTQLLRAVAVVEELERQSGVSDYTTLFKCQMLAKANRFEDAIRIAEGAAERSPSFKTATAAAMAHKRSGDLDGAIRWFRKAADLDPKNETSLLDIGDISIDLGRYPDALAAYEEAMRRKPDHDWAVPSAVFCRWKLTGDPALLEELRAMATADPDQCGVADALKQMVGGYTFEDRRRRAQGLMQLAEPGFDPARHRRRHAHPPPKGSPGERNTRRKPGNRDGR